ncbi:MAG: Vitamin B12-dependent ribonucleotide reductase, partial [Bdellovibrionaceae bacterium]|nr:Vitamin B12-dependent ribonucleotide reductase [Pseudobdellovibrionaceae bacterium]
ATVKDISETYFKAWKLGLKSIALYRDGSKFVQPLSTHVEKKTTPASAGLKQVELKSEFPKCTECGFDTVLESGCYRCTNCGTTTACSS